MPAMRWVVFAGLLGALSSGLFSATLHFPRDLFIGAHAALVLCFLAVLVRKQGIDPGLQLRRRWQVGLVAGALVGALLVRLVVRQPASARPEGLGLAWALFWDAGLYGVIDALLLSVLPVLLIYGARPVDELRRPAGRLRWGFAALLASMLLTAAYHLGFAEFRNSTLVAPLIGNAIVTLTYLASGSPIAALLSHALMHAAAVLHGMATTAQLPPH